MFTRSLSAELIKQLKEDKVFKNNLLPDIKDGKVFPAVRNERVDFYFKGGKLFSFSSAGLSTHIKYATTPEDNAKNYVTERDFIDKCSGFIKDFKKSYEKIKNNCALYSKDSEAACVSYLYSKHTFIQAAADMVVLDVEVSFESDEENRKQDQIDILLYSKKARELKFVEAKLYANKEIRSRNEPEVIGQVERYNRQIKKNKNNILNAYKEYIAIMKILFGVELKAPAVVLSNVGLYIFNFDDDQKRGNLERKIIPKLDAHQVRHYFLGNPSNINIQTLWDRVTRT